MLSRWRLGMSQDRNRVGLSSERMSSSLAIPACLASLVCLTNLAIQACSIASIGSFGSVGSSDSADKTRSIALIPFSSSSSLSSKMNRRQLGQSELIAGCLRPCLTRQSRTPVHLPSASGEGSAIVLPLRYLSTDSTSTQPAGYSPAIVRQPPLQPVTNSPPPTTQR